MEALEKFLATYPSKKYPKGAIILHQDDEPPCAYVIKDGLVKVYDITAAGDEKPILFDQRHEFFPIAWVFHFIERSKYFYEAYTDVVVYKIPREDITQFLQRNSDATYELFVTFVHRYLEFQSRILSLEQTKAADKVLFNLNFLMNRFGKAVDDTKAHLHLPLTQQDLANFVGLTRETTGIELKKLEKKGVLRKSRHQYTIYIKKLRSLLSSK